MGNVHSSSNEKIAAMVLGLNDALIELTGALVGLSFALRDHELVALAGLITGVAAAMSMAASAYMHARQEVATNAKMTGIYTGLSYLVVVILLVLPYFLLDSILSSVALMLSIALVVIVVMSYYTARYRKVSFWKEFLMMFIFSLGVAVATFVIGQVLKSLIGIEI